MRVCVFFLVGLCLSFNVKGQITDYDAWMNSCQAKQQVLNDLCYYTLKLPPKSAVCYYEVQGRDTLYLYTYNDIYCFPPLKFTSKKQEQFYWRTVRDVKKVLPYARMVSRVLYDANQKMATMTNEKEKKAFLKETEKQLFKRYEKELKAMSINQGKLLVRLIDRECNQSAYSIIRTYKGPVSAWVWQGVAKLFGSDLKAEYDINNKDKIIERVITLVEAGQL